MIDARISISIVLSLALFGMFCIVMDMIRGDDEDIVISKSKNKKFISKKQEEEFLIDDVIFDD